MRDHRYELLLYWINQVLATPVAAIAPASNDASFRRYFRVQHKNISYIVMDAPPDKENMQSFVAIARAFKDLGLHTPDVLEADLDQGFLLLTDLGTRHYLTALDATSAAKLYGDALDALLRLQIKGNARIMDLPIYDERLLKQEMMLFVEWFLIRYLRLALDSEDLDILDTTSAALCRSALTQPQVWVHRDYHSRNLMVVEHGNPGVLDFQDAVVGPITYDLVSLLRDCYIAWPQAQVRHWALSHQRRLQQQGLAQLEDTAAFLRWFDWMGLQRHLKAIGIFARLNLRDGKPGYLADIPRTLGYVREVSACYPELRAFACFIEQKVLKSVSKSAVRESGSCN